MVNLFCNISAKNSWIVARNLSRVTPRAYARGFLLSKKQSLSLQNLIGTPWAVLRYCYSGDTLYVLCYPTEIEELQKLTAK